MGRLEEGAADFAQGHTPSSFSLRNHHRSIGDIKNCFPGCCTLQACAKIDNFEINCHDQSK
jgi:hypothetical protein